MLKLCDADTCLACRAEALRWTQQQTRTYISRGIVLSSSISNNRIPLLASFACDDAGQLTPPLWARGTYSEAHLYPSIQGWGCAPQR